MLGKKLGTTLGKPDGVLLGIFDGILDGVVLGLEGLCGFSDWKMASISETGLEISVRLFNPFQPGILEGLLLLLDGCHISFLLPTCTGLVENGVNLRREIGVTCLVNGSLIGTGSTKHRTSLPAGQKSTQRHHHHPGSPLCRRCCGRRSCSELRKKTWTRIIQQ